MGLENKVKRLTKKRDKAYSKAAQESIEQGADTPFDMGVGTETRAYKKAGRLSEKIDKLKGKQQDKAKDEAMRRVVYGPFAGSTSRGSKRNR